MSGDIVFEAVGFALLFIVEVGIIAMVVDCASPTHDPLRKDEWGITKSR